MNIPAAMLPHAPPLKVAPLPEGERKAARRSIKIQREQNAAVTRQRQERQALITQIENEKEEAAAAHITLCEPKQARLAEIVNLQVLEAVDRLPKDAKLEAERIKLQGEIDAANDSLQEVIRRCDDRIHGIQLDMAKLPTSDPDSVFESRLVSLASPKVLDELFVAHVESFWCDRRLEAAKVYANEFAHQGEAGRKFALEVAAASAASVESRLNVDRLRQEAIDE